MDSDLSGSIVLLIVLLILSAFFSAAETSITSISKGRLLALADEYPNKKKKLMWLTDSISSAVNLTLIGNNLVNIASSAVATSLALQLFGKIGTAYAVIVLTAFIVIFCEVLPKNFAIAHSDTVVLSTLSSLQLFRVILSPFALLISIVLKIVGKITGTNLESSSAVISREEFDHIVTEGSESGALEEDESKMIRGVIDFEDTRVSEVMVPRIDMIALADTDSIEDSVKLFVGSGHSRIPVYHEDLDDIRGILYAKDLLIPLSVHKDRTIIDLMRKPTFIPETMKTDEVLEIMKKTKTHIAIVVDEYGGVAGVITMEDLIEEIVGDIQDEYDKETPDIQKDAENVYTVQGQVNLEDLSEALDYNFADDFEEVDTLAGMVLELSGNFPAKGAVIDYKEWKIEVLDVQNHRVLLVKMTYCPERAIEEE